jgi:hypothetical protein
MASDTALPEVRSIWNTASPLVFFNPYLFDGMIDKLIAQLRVSSIALQVVVCVDDVCSVSTEFSAV